MLGQRVIHRRKKRPLGKVIALQGRRFVVRTQGGDVVFARNQILTEKESTMARRKRRKHSSKRRRKAPHSRKRRHSKRRRHGGKRRKARKGKRRMPAGLRKYWADVRAGRRSKPRRRRRK